MGDGRAVPHTWETRSERVAILTGRVLSQIAELGEVIGGEARKLGRWRLAGRRIRL